MIKSEIKKKDVDLFPFLTIYIYIEITLAISRYPLNYRDTHNIFICNYGRNVTFTGRRIPFTNTGLKIFAFARADR